MAKERARAVMVAASESTESGEARAFNTRHFGKDCKAAGIGDEELCDAIADLNNGLGDPGLRRRSGVCPEGNARKRGFEGDLQMTANARKHRVRQARKGAFAAIHSAAAGLHRAGGISKATMREYDRLCIEPVREVSPREVVRIRTKMNVSQNLFARYLNTSESTIQKWETGAKRPSAIATRLLRVIEKHGLKVLA